MTRPRKKYVLLDNGGETADRYTLIWRKPETLDGRAWHLFVGFSENPYHPQGVGMHGELRSTDFHRHKLMRFRALGRVIDLEALPTMARKLADDFVAYMEKTE